jgi:hypothetical protein
MQGNIDQILDNWKQDISYVRAQLASWEDFYNRPNSQMPSPSTSLDIVAYNIYRERAPTIFGDRPRLPFKIQVSDYYIKQKIEDARTNSLMS